MNERRDTLAALRGLVDRIPDTTAVHVVDPDGGTTRVSYGRLWAGAAAAGAGLARLGVERGDRLILALPTCIEFFFVYLGCLRSGIVPAIVPESGSQPGALGFEHVELAARTLSARGVVLRQASPAAEVLPLPVIEVTRLLDEPAGIDPAMDPEPEAIAHLQGTSGTTSVPRWAIVRHANVTANVEAIAAAVNHRASDLLVTWLPMSHDMGLIGVSYAWRQGVPLVAADPSNFIRNPLSWPELISRFGGTLSPAPNSAFQVCCRIARLRPPKGLDLSSWRVALCGAEPVHASTLDEFHQAFGRFGLRREALMPVYGLAEATLAVTISSRTEPFRAERVRADSCAPGSSVAARADARGDKGAGELAVVACGRVIPGHALRIVDDDGNELPPGVVGEIEFRGDSVIGGYWGMDGDTGLKRDGFLRTGDLGYLRDGELFVTGRKKEILIINGKNLSPLQIEATIERALGVSFTPAVVAIDLIDEHLRSNTLHLLLDTRLRAGATGDVEARIRETLEEVFGLRGATLHWTTGGHIPRTDSGKIQRFRCRELIAQRLAEAASRPDQTLSAMNV